MLKILKPNWKRASQGCCAASLKNGSRIFNIPANGSHRADHHWRHQLARYFTCAVFPFVMAGTKKRGFDFPPKKPKMPAGRWCSVNRFFFYTISYSLLNHPSQSAIDWARANEWALCFHCKNSTPLPRHQLYAREGEVEEEDGRGQR
jgi:hypothetical protein